MITPRFNIDQTETDLIFTIQAPYASIADAEIYADLDTFCFYASPYYLRVHLSGHIEETDASKGSYDADNGTFTICVQKVNKGEHFQDLDFLTALLTPNQSKKHDLSRPVVEVISNENLDSVEEDCSDGESNEWYIEQCPYEEPSEAFLLSAPHYGFANKISGAFQNFKTEFLEVIDLPDPDQTPISERSKLRTERELEDFSDDHYLADWAQPDIIEPMLTFKALWENGSEASFLDDEKDVLKDLPKKEFLLDKREEHMVSLSLIDILYSYAYNVRSTMGENTVESAWAVNKLSGTLSWLTSFNTLKEVVIVAVRRSLCYPLYRHWDLSMKVLDDVKRILTLGKKQILKSLLELHALFSNSEPRYILNQLYIRDYCIWIQHVSDSFLKSLLVAINKVELSKADVALDLEELETAARLVQMEEEASKIIHKNKSEELICREISSLIISKDNTDGSRSSSGTSDSEDDSSSSDNDDSSSSSSSESDLDSDDLSDIEPNITAV
ncbi:protein SHQ1 homolog [Thrips palmi]|uniref:Protein SHQ1 homolog n=1 Tax=Thrips palmi TaxID=161013 RepID=A0A6P9ABK9_THRPL|nr:protein SHQ1 homolog [Thrips palmi]XP_034255498.1 protein SHQ1 homolog [Thrips palmi]